MQGEQAMLAVETWGDRIQPQFRSGGTRATNPNVIFHGSSTETNVNVRLDLHRAQVAEYRLWPYVCIERISQRFAMMFPFIGRILGRSIGQGVSDGQRLLNGNRDHIRRHYGRMDALIHSRGGFARQALPGAYGDEADFEELEDNHPLVTLLRNVNPEDSWYDVAFETAMFVKLTGKFYWWIVPNGFGLDVQLWVVPSQWVDEIRSKTGELVKLVVTPQDDHTGAAPWEIPGDEVVMGKLKHPATKRDGFSPMEAGALWIENAKSIEQSRRHAFKMGVNPDVLVHVDEDAMRGKNPSDDVIKRLKQKFVERMSGSRRWGEPVVVPPGSKVEPWSHTPREMDFPGTSPEVRDNNLALYGVPPLIAGLTKDFNRATADAANVVFCENTMDPFLSWFAGVLTEKLATRFDESGEIVLWYPSCVPSNFEAEKERDQFLVTHGGMSPDELAAKYGHEVLGTPSSETRYFKAGFVTLDDDLAEERAEKMFEREKELSGDDDEDENDDESTGSEEDDADDVDDASDDSDDED